MEELAIAPIQKYLVFSCGTHIVNVKFVDPDIFGHILTTCLQYPTRSGGNFPTKYRDITLRSYALCL